MPLRTDYANDTDSTDTHPGAHNDTNTVVNTHDAAIAANTANITANATAIGNNTAAIGTNTANIATLTSRVDSLDAIASLLFGTIPPTSGVGTVGDFYLDTTGGILYGPKSSTGPTEKITVGGTANQVFGGKFGVHVQFATAGFVDRVRYWRAATDNDSIRVLAWMSPGGATQIAGTEKDDVRPGQSGWFEVALGTPVVVTAGQSRVFSYERTVASGAGVSYRDSVSAVTNTANCTFLNYVQGSSMTVTTTQTHFIEPVFTPGAGPWPVSLNFAARANRGPAGYWVWAWDAGAISSVVATAQRTIFIRFVAGQAFDGLQWDVPNAVASSTLIGGVYQTDANGLPTALVAQQSMDTSTTGGKTMTFTALPAGTYWVAALPSHAINWRASSNANPIFVSPSTTMTVTANWNGWWLNGQTSLPNPFSGTPLLASGPVPAPLLRLA